MLRLYLLSVSTASACDTRMQGISKYATHVTSKQEDIGIFKCDPYAIKPRVEGEQTEQQGIVGSTLLLYFDLYFDRGFSCTQRGEYP